MSEAPVESSSDQRDQRRIHALSFMREVPLPEERDRSVSDDKANLWVVLKLFLRAWPYISPQVFGRWFIPGRGVEEQMADSVGGGGYGFSYAPFLITLAALGGPLTGLVPAGFEFPMSLLYGLIAAMVVCSWPVAFAVGKNQTFAAIGLIASGLGANLIATFVIDGFADGVYTGLVSLACVAGWMVHFRSQEGGIGYRIRVHAHLVYFYSIVSFIRFLDLAVGLVLIDLLNQSILQNEPIMPTLAAMMGAPELARGVADSLSQDQRYELVWLYVKIFLFLHIGLLIPLRIVERYYRVWVLQRINQDLRIALVERWHQLSLRYHSDHRVGDSIFRIYQDSAQVTAVIDRLMGVTITIFSYFTAVFFVTILSPIIGLIASTIIIPAVLWARWAMPRMRTRSLVARAATSDVTSRIQESFSAIRLIKAYGAEDRAQARFEEDSIISFNASFRVRHLIAFVTIIMFTISATFLLGGEFLIALWAFEGRETFASEFIALVGVSFVVWNFAAYDWTKTQFVDSTKAVRSLMGQWLSAQDIAMGLQRVFDILDIEPDIHDDADAIELHGLRQEIRFDQVAFAYQADRPVLADVSFTAKPGMVTAIVGPTGSGKSTLMGLLLRLYDPTAGSISIDGLDLKRYQVESLRRNVAVALQENVLFALSVRDNIRYVAPDASDQQVREAVRVACMDDYVDALPDGLDTLLGDRGGKLSTGQRQRLSIARAVVRDTLVLILDEPTAALDAATEHRVMTNLAEWGRDRAIFLITHRISTIQRADHILYLDEGHIKESGDHESLMALPDGRYRAFVETESNLYRNAEHLTR